MVVRHVEYGCCPAMVFYFCVLLSMKANLKPAMNIFYFIALVQGVLYLLWVVLQLGGVLPVRFVTLKCKFPSSWAEKSVWQYLISTRIKCDKEPGFARDRDLITYAIELLDSDSGNDYQSGARILASLANEDKDRVRQLIRPSRNKVQKLLNTLAWTHPDDQEIRLHAACILEHLAGDICLAHFPGALQSISCLLEPPHGGVFPTKQDENGSRTDVLLILLGLLIVERLAHDRQNCREIFRTQGLVAKIVSPLFTASLIQDMGLLGVVHNQASRAALLRAVLRGEDDGTGLLVHEETSWAGIIYSSFSVVVQLIAAQGEDGMNLRCQIASNQVALTNLENIISSSDNVSERIKTRAVQIQTALFMDDRTCIPSERRGRFVQMVMNIFHSEHGMKQVDQISEEEAELKEKAGEALLMLSMTGQTNNEASLWVTEPGGAVHQLTEILPDTQNRIILRIIAAELLENLCSHYILEQRLFVMETILPKALTGLITIKEDEPAATQEDDRGHNAANNDEESQIHPVNAHTHTDKDEKVKKPLETRLQAALLSLVASICANQQISADEFGSVVQQHCAPRQAGTFSFVRFLKEIVKSNDDVPTDDSLRIVKATGKIVLSMIKKSSPRLVQEIRDDNIVESLSKAAKAMSCLESCILFAGTHHHGVMNRQATRVRPLSGEIVEEARKLLEGTENNVGQASG